MLVDCFVVSRVRRGEPDQRPTAYLEALGTLLLSRSGRGAHAGAAIRGWLFRV